ncbi:MAG TPA: potassium transporter Kup [Gemmatimonadales bacterium]|jgi:KUP system potassium uptake protein|nr:potassium transporter Kup [Gemmatimonadales bacterium]
MTTDHEPASRHASLAAALAALGVVYGDIGTSPLYALKECFAPEYGVAPTAPNVLGVLSLIFWSLNFVVSLKYLTFIMQADNRGEGGIMALLALLHPRHRDRRTRRLLVGLALFGAALLYGDGVITPAISVLGAVEGIDIASSIPGWVVPILASVILVALFVFQHRGTARVGAVFGRVMVVWFLSIALLGIGGIMRHPEVIAAINPWHAITFFLGDWPRGFLILGAVVLVVTGGEALYADMGHFGRRPIRLGWFAVVLPALVLNYFGQGALLLSDASAARNPFYSLVPSWALYPMVGIATAAAVVASQALISGAFSLTRQALQLGYSPRVTILHTSQTAIGQIYLPGVNRLLAVTCVLLVLVFQSTSNLASAYGIAVTGTMTITTVLFCTVARDRWQWPRWRVALVGALFLSADLAFLGANLAKVASGGWLPLLIAVVLYVLMTTWKRGRESVASALRESALPLDLFLEDIRRRRPARVPGTAVFMTSDPAGVPVVLLHHLKHNKVLHETVVIMSIEGEEIPQVPREERLTLKSLGDGFHRVVGRYGFMETPDVPALLASLQRDGLRASPAETSFYLGRETLLPDGNSRMARWRKLLFIVMARNAQSATAFFNLPPNRVLELGARIQL